MQSILILAMLGTLLLLPGAGTAETTAECQTGCAAEKGSTEASCPPPGEGADQERAKCLQVSQDTFRSCLADCPQPEPAATPPDAPAGKAAETVTDTPTDPPAEQ